ncbi:hypothetical protein GPECTOR_28g736 [Gonium pectorale]|uniref:Uncharacterized protein n=1 Tax=Gonium pectorale TaxID=33097 RepID=A0A150GG66_GONPE|nr:hypothetical protein GPECTOR_28g736 [Gonium pectorale]|eukprot:KXZ48330.1 hypothetical protein GPECTOR_28g736 [Gonium pectorale]
MSVSQDKQHFGGGFSSGRGLTGGGTAGGSSKGGDYTFQRQVPKFLQRYSHLLGKTAADEDEPVVEGGPPGLGKGRRDEDEEEEGDEREDNIEAEALRRAMADNPELAAEFQGTLEGKLKAAEAAEEKERGNTLFGKKKYEEAAKSFSKCIALDPSNEVYWSNRSAALAALERWEEAAADARRVVALKPGWAKGWARLGAACMGLKLYGDAREAYEKALRIEPDDMALRRVCEKAESMELQQARQGKHTFKKMRVGGAGGGAAGGGGAADGGAAASGPAPKPAVDKRVLSFADEDEG